MVENVADRSGVCYLLPAMSSSNGESYETPPAGFAISPETFECPACGQVVEATRGPVAQLLHCPACGEHFVIAAIDGSTDVPEEGAANENEQEARELGELDSLRMRHLVVTRRTAMRSRTYNILGAATCLMAAAKLVVMTVKEVRLAGWHLRQVSFVLFAIVALSPIPYLLRRAAHWARESRGVKMPDPETPPDFTALSDGSQHAKNLEDLH
jgi:predicted RNA-binding Zn-ribbon protein involved in translation (DUF1610 family)